MTMYNDLAIYTPDELRHMIWFYRRGPRANVACRQLIRRIIAEARQRKQQ